MSFKIFPVGTLIHKHSYFLVVKDKVICFIKTFNFKSVYIHSISILK